MSNAARANQIQADVRIPPDPTPVKSDYSEVELLQPIVNVTPRDRKGQRVMAIRAIEGVVFKEHPAGVEVTGAATWKGIVPWANIKSARR